VPPVVALKPVAGDQLYVLAPLAVKVVVAPAQISGGEFTVTVNAGLTLRMRLLK